MDRTVSIVIVSHEFKEYLEGCIKQIEKNTERALIADIVVVDNGSKKKYDLRDLRQLTSFPLSLIRLKKNTSYAYANNRGVESSAGSYICFLNNDVEVLKDWLPQLHRVLDGDKHIGAVGPKMIFEDGTIQFAGYEKDPKTKFQKHKFRAVKTDHTVSGANIPGPVSTLTGACLMVRREDAHFDERYWFGCEDVDLCVSLKQKNKVIFYEPRAVVIHHEETTRSSGLIGINFERNRELFKEKWGKEWGKLLWKVVS